VKTLLQPNNVCIKVVNCLNKNFSTLVALQVGVSMLNFAEEMEAVNAYREGF